MTSDAKIGLLLGLVFIFIIAFLVNGLPNFHKDKNVNNNELTTNIVSLENNPPAIAAKERKAQQEFEQTASAQKQGEKVEILSIAGDSTQSATGTEQVPEVGAGTSSQPLPATAQEQIQQSQLPQTVGVQKYVVREGDNLMIIAQKIYGQKEGSKNINITKIFEANRKLLRSADEIYVGQELIIPPLVSPTADKNKTSNAFSSKMFEKVESIGQKHLATDSQEAKQIISDSKIAPRGREYAVQEGDCLWGIALKQLGNSNRYTEIIKLNRDILDDENNLAVGMRLKIPVR